MGEVRNKRIMKIILGSSSRYRQQVLREAGIEFEVMKPNIDEKAIRFGEPEKLVLAIANAKADALLEKVNEPAILITSDQVVLCEGKIREKPLDKQQAEEFLRSYAAHPVEVVNGIVVANTATGRRVQGINRQTATYKPSFETVIADLLKTEDVMHCAGALQTEHPLAMMHIDHMTGGQDGFMGMPLEVVKRLMREVE